MKFLTITLLCILAQGAFAAETTASTSKPKMEAKEELKLIKADELKKMEKQVVYIFDANDNQTRQKEGVIPGATALKSTHDYDVTVLPNDKKANIVFYCGGPMCMASHDAAKRAIKAGYSNVAVMSDGITGWKKAGYDTKKFTN